MKSWARKLLSGNWGNHCGDQEKPLRAVREERGDRSKPSCISYQNACPFRCTKCTALAEILRQLFSGIYTVDNLDYVQRDAFMTGFSLDMVDIPRIRFYSFFSRSGLTLHHAGISALSRLLNARLNLYANVYFHRTTRALDLHLQEIFRETMEIVLPCNPAENLNRYMDCDDWQLFQLTREWLGARDPVRRRLGREWEKLHLRQVKWKMAFSAEVPIDQLQRGVGVSRAADYEQGIRANLPAPLKKISFKIDLATQDPRPLNPYGRKR